MEWKTLYLVEESTEEIEAHLRTDSDILRFKMLPFIAVKDGHSWSTRPPTGLREIEFTDTTYSVAWSINRALLEAGHLARTWAPNGNRWVLGIKSPPQYLAVTKQNSGIEIEPLQLTQIIRIAHPSVISLSLQLRQGAEMSDDHILSITTKVASKSIPVLVAAGNWGIFGAGTLSPFARLPWTIAVGATSDSEGKKLHPTSSIGEIGSKCGDGVTVVAYGEDYFAPGVFGTSFAVPRVAQYLLVLTSFILQLRAIEETKRSSELGGVPLLQYITVDKGFKGFNSMPSMPMPMIPRLGVNNNAVIFTLNILHEAGLSICIEPTPSIVRRMLIASAIPMNHYEHHEVGYGFVSKEATIEYLSKFSGASLAELFIEKSNLDDATYEALKSYKLTNEDELKYLYNITAESSLKFSIDFSTGEIFASMRDPGIDPKETGFHKKPSNYSWPPKL